MAYRIRNFDNLSVHQVNDIFLRGRGLCRSVESVDTGEDFRANHLAPHFQQPDVSMPPAVVVDDELESVV